MEVLLGITVFSLFLFAVGLTMIAGQENTVIGGAEARASYLASRALDVARSVRDGSFSAVTVGQHGYAVNPSGAWAFSGTTSTTTGSYTTWVYVSSSSTGLLLSARSVWKHGYNKSGSVILKTELTDWRTAGQVGNWGSPSVDGSVTEAGSPDFNDVKVVGNYALVTGGASGGGNGLYIYDISDTANPTRMNAAFNLGSDGYQMAVRGRTLYVLTGDSNAELKVYKMTNLPSLTYVTSYNLQGSGRGRTANINDTLLYVGTTQSGMSGENEFYVFDVSNSGSLTYKTSVDDASTTLDIGLTGTAAYLASADDSGELAVLNVTNSGSIVTASGAPLNISGTEDGIAIAVSGTAALLGRTRGTGIQELVMHRLPASGGAPTSGGPWYHEMSGSVVGVAMDPTQCYAFAATRQKWKALQILRMKDFTLTEVASYTLSSQAGKRLFYEPKRDRVFFLSDNTLFIFKPATATGSC
jgi:hypothetical protein